LEAERLQDPSELTIATVQREVAHLSERLEMRIEGLEGQISTRLDAIDRATDKFETSLTRVPTDVDRQTSQLGLVFNEKLAIIERHILGMEKIRDEVFKSIQSQFTERDKWHDSIAAANKDAIHAALEAAKESVVKAEASQAKIIESGSLQISDIKERLTRIESIAIGQSTQKTETHTNTGTILGIIGALIGFISLAAVFIRMAMGSQ
jgi:hypothetical protein